MITLSLDSNVEDIAHELYAGVAYIGLTHKLNSVTSQMRSLRVNGEVASNSYCAHEFIFSTDRNFSRSTSLKNTRLKSAVQIAVQISGRI